MQHEKSKIVAYLLWLVVGAFGGHRFYLGRIKTGIALGGLLVLSFATSITGTVLMMRAIDDGKEIMDLALNVNGFTILTYAGTFLRLAWVVWYLVDVILIHFMMKKDRAISTMLSQAQTSEVFE